MRPVGSTLWPAIAFWEKKSTNYLESPLLVPSSPEAVRTGSLNGIAQEEYKPDLGQGFSDPSCGLEAETFERALELGEERERHVPEARTSPALPARSPNGSSGFS